MPRANAKLLTPQQSGEAAAPTIISRRTGPYRWRTRHSARRRGLWPVWSAGRRNYSLRVTTTTSCPASFLVTGWSTNGRNPTRCGSGMRWLKTA